ncbi:hypothetical protein HELRODRAFT_148277, partial [Helobdella robusta]|uniref:HMG box domain-containing protein n=1 Tax=Helobdella robusta TaxID=6412 RepID=T1EK65_HELRO
KRPLNAFMLWAKEERSRLLRCAPGVHNSSLSIMLGIKWKSMTSQEKLPYVKKHLKLSE